MFIRSTPAGCRLKSDQDIDTKRSRLSIGKAENGSREKERVSLFGPISGSRQGERSSWRQSKAGSMTAPRTLRHSQFSFAPRAPSSTVTSLGRGTAKLNLVDANFQKEQL